MVKVTEIPAVGIALGSFPSEGFEVVTIYSLYIYLIFKKNFQVKSRMDSNSELAFGPQGVHKSKI